MHGTRRLNRWTRHFSHLFFLHSIKVTSRRTGNGITHVGHIISALGQFVSHFNFNTMAHTTSAPFTLHQNCITGSSTSRQLSIESRDFQQKSELALKSLARSLMATSEHQVKELFLDRNHIPSYGLRYSRDAAIFSLEMEKRGEDSEIWKKNFNFLRDCLIISNKKWKVAGMSVASYKIESILITMQ